MSPISFREGLIKSGDETRYWGHCSKAQPRLGRAPYGIPTSSFIRLWNKYALPAGCSKYWQSTCGALGKQGSHPNLSIVTRNLPASVIASSGRRAHTGCTCTMSSVWSRFKNSYPRPQCACPLGKWDPQPGNLAHGSAWGAGALKEQGTWLGRAGKVGLSTSKHLVIFLLFKFEATLWPRLASLFGEQSCF